jgi:hypothetical protein
LEIQIKRRKKLGGNGMSLKQKLVPLFLAAFVLIALTNVSYGYAWFDETTTTQEETIPIGNFANPFLQTYYTGFETYNNTTTGSNVNVTIDGVRWQVFSVVRGTTGNDNKIGSRSARFTRDSYMNSRDSFIDLRTISFYMGKMVNSPSTGKTYQVAISDNATSNWYIIATGAMPNTFTYFEFDVQSMIQSGITLPNNVTVTSSTPLFVRIYFNGNQGVANTRQNMNLDELRITYKP